MAHAPAPPAPILEAWEDFVRTGSLDPRALRPDIAQAWVRSRQAGLDPFQGRSTRLLAGPALEQLLEKRRSLIEVALPALREAESGGADPDAAGIQSLFAVMAVLDDTNLLHRGGVAGLVYVQRAARDFLGQGGVFQPRWRDQALALHRDCILRHLSPGGSADVLAAALFLRDLEGW